MDVMDAGRLAFAMDPTGAPYGIWQAGTHLGVGLYNEPGTVVWNELMTCDYDGAKAFYGKVFGLSFDEIGEGITYSTVRRAGDGEVVAGLGELDASVPAEVPASWVTFFFVESSDASARQGRRARRHDRPRAVRHPVRPDGAHGRRPGRVVIAGPGTARTGRRRELAPRR